MNKSNTLLKTFLCMVFVSFVVILFHNHILVSSNLTTTFSKLIHILISLSKLIAMTAIISTILYGHSWEMLIYSTILFLASVPFLDGALYWNPVTIILFTVSILPAGLISIYLLVEHIKKKYSK